MLLALDRHVEAMLAVAKFENLETRPLLGAIAADHLKSVISTAVIAYPLRVAVLLLETFAIPETTLPAN